MLDPTLSAYALAVSVASGVVAAGMHATTLAGTEQPWPPRRQLVAQLVSTSLVGVAACQLMRWLPWRVDVVAVLLVSAISGAYLGPRGVGWLFLSGVQVARRSVPALRDIPDPPAPPGATAPPTPTEEASDA